MQLPRRSSVRVGFVAIHSAPFASAIRQTPRYQRVGGERRLGADRRPCVHPSCTVGDPTLAAWRV